MVQSVPCQHPHSCTLCTHMQSLFRAPQGGLWVIPFCTRMAKLTLKQSTGVSLAPDYNLRYTWIGHIKIKNQLKMPPISVCEEEQLENLHVHSTCSLFKKHPCLSLFLLSGLHSFQYKREPKLPASQNRQASNIILRNKEPCTLNQNNKMLDLQGCQK